MNLLNCLGIGTVTSTKDTNTNQIMVYVPSMFPQADGRNTANAQAVERSSVNATGDTVKSTLLHSNSLPAIWKNMGNNNRMTSPDVREGSQVAIYQVSGQNLLYWTLDGVNANTFRLETVIYGWNASPEVSENADFDVNNGYMMKVSTHEGLLSLRTSMANGEKSAFDIQINAMAGTIQIGGNEGNFFVLDDMAHSLTYTNADKAVFNINKKTMTVYMPEQLNLFTDLEINVKTKTLNIQTDVMNVDIGLTRWKGEIQHTGNTEQLGNYTQDGNTTQTGNYNQTGNITQEGNTTSSGTIHADIDVTSLVSLNTHLTSEVKGGSDISGPPIV